MSLFAWNPKYALEVPEIDAQHRKLFEAAGRLHTAMSGGQGREALGKILDDLIAYTASHFAMEERLMQQHRYPAAAQHKAEHDALAHRVTDFQREFQSGRIALSVEMLQFLRDWLSHHILESDTRLGRHLGAKPAMTRIP